MSQDIGDTCLRSSATRCGLGQRAAMSKARLVITARLVEHQTPAEVAAPLRRAPRLGLQAQGPLPRPRARRRSSPVPDAPRPPPRAAVRRGRSTSSLRLRKELTDAGLGRRRRTPSPGTCEHHHATPGLPDPPSAAILARAGLVIPEPKKRPKSSYIRFEAAMPNETWQSDFTHYRLTRPTADPAPTSRSSAGSTTAPATPCTSPPTSAITTPDRASTTLPRSRCAGTASPPPPSPTTAWSTPSARRRPRRPQQLRARATPPGTSSRRTPDPTTPPPAARPSGSSRP